MSSFFGRKFKRFEIIAHNRGYTIDVNGVVYNKKGIIMKPYIINGYKFLRIRYGKDKKMICIKFSRIQAYMKFGDAIYEEDICVRHINGNSLDDSWDNIMIGSHSDNMRDIPKSTRVKSSAIASSKRKSSYSKDKIIAIKKAHNDGLSYKQIMEKFNITSKGTISYIVNNAYIYYGIEQVSKL